MIAQELEVSLHMAFVEARQKQHEFITVEHLLLAMLDNPSAAEVLKACGVDLDELRGVLTDFIGEHTPRLSPHSDGGSVERWCEPSFRTMYHEVFEGDPLAFDPFDAEHRIATKEIPSPAVCSASAVCMLSTARSCRATPRRATPR